MKTTSDPKKSDE